jgi:hypothetical protein
VSRDVVALLIVEARAPVSLLDERRERTLFEIMFETKKTLFLNQRHHRCLFPAHALQHLAV